MEAKHVLTSFRCRYSQLLLIFKGWYAHKSEQRSDAKAYLVEVLHHWVNLTSFPEFDKVAAMQTLLFMREPLLVDFPSHPTILALMR